MAEYVSARYVPFNPQVHQPGEKPVTAFDAEGNQYWLDESSEVGDWLRYREAGGSIDPAATGEVTNANVTTVPDTLVGGPTIKEVFNVHN